MQPPDDPRLLRLAPDDNLCAATAALEPGQRLWFGGKEIIVRDRIPTGHKIAIAPIAAGEKVRKYGAPIGSATRPIEPGEYVHTHNLRSDYLPTYARDDATPS